MVRVSERGAISNYEKNQEKHLQRTSIGNKDVRSRRKTKAGIRV